MKRTLTRILTLCAAVCGLQVFGDTETTFDGLSLVWSGNSATESKTLSTGVELGKPFTLVVKMTYKDTSSKVGNYLIGKIGAGQIITPFCIAADVYSDFATTGTAPAGSVTFKEQKNSGWYVGVGSEASSATTISWNTSAKQGSVTGDHLAIDAFDAIYVAYSGSVDAEGSVSGFRRLVYAHNATDSDYYTLSDSSDVTFSITEALDTISVFSTSSITIPDVDFNVWLDNTQRDVTGMTSVIQNIINPPYVGTVSSEGVTWSRTLPSSFTSTDKIVYKGTGTATLPDGYTSCTSVTVSANVALNGGVTTYSGFAGTGTINYANQTTIPYNSEAKTYTVGVSGTISATDNVMILGGSDSCYTKHAFNDGLTITTPRFLTGNGSNARNTIDQYTGSTVTATGTGADDDTQTCPMILAHWPSKVVYTIHGGTLALEPSTGDKRVMFGRDGTIDMTVGTNEGEALFKAPGIWGADRDSKGSCPLKIGPKGTLLVGALGVDLNSAKTLTLKGGMLANYAADEVTAATPIAVEADTTSVISNDYKMAIKSTLSGSGSLTKKGSGELWLTGTVPATISVAATEGTLVIGSGKETNAMTKSGDAKIKIALTDAEVKNGYSVTGLAEGITVDGYVDANGTALENSSSGNTYAPAYNTINVTESGSVNFNDVTVWSKTEVPTSGTARIKVGTDVEATVSVNTTANVSLDELIIDGAGSVTLTSGDSYKVIAAKVSLANGATLKLGTGLSATTITVSDTTAATINASALTEAGAAITVPAGDTITLVGGSSSAVKMAGLITNNGTLKTKGKLNLSNTSNEIPSGSTVEAVDGEVTYQVATRTIKGTITIDADAIFHIACDADDPISYGGEAAVFNVYGTLDMGARRYTLHNNVKFYFYAGCTVNGTGSDHSNWPCAFEMWKANTLEFRKNGDNGGTIEFNSSIGVEQNTTVSVAEGVTVNFNGTTKTDGTTPRCTLSAGTSTFTKTGNGKVVFKTGTATAIPITLSAGNIDFATDTSNTLAIKSTVTGKVGVTGTGTISMQTAKMELLSNTAMTAHFEATSGESELKWASGGSYGDLQFCSTDSQDSPVIKINNNATLKLTGHDFSGWKGSMNEHGWIVNNGTLVYDGDGGSRFFRDHIVIGDGATTSINSTSRKVLLFGGTGSADSAQIMLPTGTATIGVGSTTGDGAALYVGNDGEGGYGTTGAGISVGDSATLTIGVPIAGPDALAKWGSGTLSLTGTMSSYTGTITLNAGKIKVATSCALAENKIVAPTGYALLEDSTTETDVTAYTVAVAVATYNGKNYASIDAAVKAAGDDNLSQITVIGSEATVPSGYAKTTDEDRNVHIRKIGTLYWTSGTEWSSSSAPTFQDGNGMTAQYADGDNTIVLKNRTGDIWLGKPTANKNFTLDNSQINLENEGYSAPGVISEGGSGNTFDNANVTLQNASTITFKSYYGNGIYITNTVINVGTGCAVSVSTETDEWGTVHSLLIQGASSFLGDLTGSTFSAGQIELAANATLTTSSTLAEGAVKSTVDGYKVTSTSGESTVTYFLVAMENYTVTLGDHPNAEVSELPATVREDAEAITFTVTPADNYKVTAVKANDETLEGSNNSYSLKVTANTIITVETELDLIGVTVDDDLTTAKLKNVTTNNIVVAAAADGKYYVQPGVTVVANYTANEGYLPATFTAEITATTTKTEITVPTEKQPTLGAAKIGTTAYATLEEAVDAAVDNDTVTLLQDVTLTARVETTKSTTITIDLGGFTITPTRTCGNGSTFDVKTGNVTITNGTIDASALTQTAADKYNNECDAITVRAGATATLTAGLVVKVDTITGSCAYPFSGSSSNGKLYVTGGTYSNASTVTGPDHETALVFNQGNVAEQLVFVSGGTFTGKDPARGDNSSKGAPSFMATGYYTVESTIGTYTAKKVETTVDPTSGDISVTVDTAIEATNIVEATVVEQVATAGTTTSGTIKVTVDNVETTVHYLGVADTPTTTIVGVPFKNMTAATLIDAKASGLISGDELYIYKDGSYHTFRWDGNAWSNNLVGDNEAPEACEVPVGTASFVKRASTEKPIVQTGSEKADTTTATMTAAANLVAPATMADFDLNGTDATTGDANVTGVTKTGDTGDTIMVVDSTTGEYRAYTNDGTDWGYTTLGEKVGSIRLPGTRVKAPDVPAGQGFFYLKKGTGTPKIRVK